MDHDFEGHFLGGAEDEDAPEDGVEAGEALRQLPHSVHGPQVGRVGVHAQRLAEQPQFGETLQTHTGLLYHTVFSF